MTEPLVAFALSVALPHPVLDAPLNVDSEGSVPWKLQGRVGNHGPRFFGSLDGGLDVVHQQVWAHHRLLGLAERAAHANLAPIR